MRILLVCPAECVAEMNATLSGLRAASHHVQLLVVGFGQGRGLLGVSRTVVDGDKHIHISGRWALWASRQYGLLHWLLARQGLSLTEYDVIHVIGLHPLGAVMHRLAAKAKVPMVLAPLPSELLKESVQGRSKWREEAMKGASALVVESDVWQRKVEKVREAVVIAPAMEAEHFRFRPRAQGSTLYIVMAAKWDDEDPIIHRPKLAMRALAEVEALLQRPLLLGVIGGGDRLHELKEYCSRLGLNTLFHNELSEEACAKEFQKADLFLHPADATVFSTYVVLAMRCGVPVVASQVDGMQQFIPDERAGVLTENKLSLWKEAILRAAAMHFDHEAIAHSMRYRYTPEQTAQALTLLYQKLSMNK